MQFKSISTTWKVIENSDVGREDGAQSLIFFTKIMNARVQIKQPFHGKGSMDIS